MRSNQDLFDTITTHLRTQGARATCETFDMCVYHASDGRKCAIGCLIPDERYTPVLEGCDLRRNGNVQSILRSLDIDPTNEMLREFQQTHDCFEPGSEWEREFRMIAQRYDLTYTEVSA